MRKKKDVPLTLVKLQGGVDNTVVRVSVARRGNPFGEVLASKKKKRK